MENNKLAGGRAEFALNAAKRASNADYKANYKSYCRKFPGMIQTNGVAAALAFAFEKGSADSVKAKAWKGVYKDCESWLKKTGALCDGEELVEYVCTLGRDDYRAITGELLALFTWISRFASGMIDSEAID